MMGIDNASGDRAYGYDYDGWLLHQPGTRRDCGCNGPLRLPAAQRRAGTLAGARSCGLGSGGSNETTDLEPLCLRGKQPAEQHRSAGVGCFVHHRSERKHDLHFQRDG